jgi:hypothetical protein
VRLEDGNGARSGNNRRTTRWFGRGQERLRSNFGAPAPAEPENRIQQPGNGECRLNWCRGRGLLSMASVGLSLASVGSEISMSELYNGIALDDDAES